MKQLTTNLRTFIRAAQLVSHEIMMTFIAVRWWLLAIALFVALRWSIIATLHGRI